MVERANRLYGRMDGRKTTINARGNNNARAYSFGQTVLAPSNRRQFIEVHFIRASAVRTGGILLSRRRRFYRTSPRVQLRNIGRLSRETKKTLVRAHIDLRTRNAFVVFHTRELFEVDLYSFRRRKRRPLPNVYYGTTCRGHLRLPHIRTHITQL